MPLPFFYTEDISSGKTSLILNEETSKHIVQVLRMQAGEQMRLTDGKGNLFVAEIIDANKKKCLVKILAATTEQEPVKKITIAISLIKNNSRFEWFLEKATEIGVTEIIPLLCTRTEKQHFRYDRMKTILISAMLQSQQCWLPVLHEPVKFLDVVNGANYQQQFIAHCIDESSKKTLTSQLISQPTNQLICIGPEGDFTVEEIQAALKNNFTPVALGNTRLRTETAGLVAVTLLQNLVGGL
jgi:16S rRNA (uracil1498-N3)-methyltransferase